MTENIELRERKKRERRRGMRETKARKKTVKKER